MAKSQSDAAGDVKNACASSKPILSNRPVGPDGKPLKPCCVCLDTKGLRDEW